MSLASALKRGMDAVDGFEQWDPFPDQSDTAHPEPARVDKRAPATRQPGTRKESYLRQNTSSRQAPVARQSSDGGKVARLPAKPRQRDSRAEWLDQGVKVNPQQFVRELERFASEESKRAVADVVMDVQPAEIEGVAKLAGRIKGRYLAKLLDVGSPDKPSVQEAEIKELTKYRETFEELNRGLDILKSAIETGDISVRGTISR